MRIVIGSTALAYHGINIRKRIKDVDVMVDSITSTLPGDDYIVIPEHIIDLIPRNNNHATADAVYTIKCSHLGWDIHNVGHSQFGGSNLWDKHKRDVINLSTHCTIIEDLYVALCDYWRVNLGNKDYLSLNQNTDEFFNDFVDYKYDHDDLHEMIAFPNKPMYTRVLKDGCSVMTDKEKFNNLPFHDQISLFQEEICVISLERYIVFGKSPLFAYQSALKKTITRLTKNWACDFITRNMIHFKMPQYDLNILEKQNG